MGMCKRMKEEDTVTEIPISRSMVGLAQPPPGVHIRVWEILCILLIFVGDLIRRKMVKERLQQTIARNIEQWKNSNVSRLISSNRWWTLWY